MITSLVGIENPAWQERSACKDIEDPSIFFARGEGSVNKARKVCATCPVIKQCLIWALKMEKGGGSMERSGVYAGLTAQQRMDLKLCDYPGCVGLRKIGKHCSQKHANAHAELRKDKERKRLANKDRKGSRWYPDDREYHMKGKVRNG